jgi:hypothetical protein
MQDNTWITTKNRNEMMKRGAFHTIVFKKQHAYGISLMYHHSNEQHTEYKQEVYTSIDKAKEVAEDWLIQSDSALNKLLADTE